VKVVFLDFDGVLNGFERWPDWAGRRWLDLDAIARLNVITEATGAVIVVTSTWRLSPSCDVVRLLGSAGVLAEVIDVTADLAGEDRGTEIYDWLNNTAEPVDGYVVLDDDADMGYVSDHLVRTTWAEGLQDEHVDQAIAVLNRQKAAA
jgi:hypothetical protein